MTRIYETLNLNLCKCGKPAMIKLDANISNGVTNVAEFFCHKCFDKLVAGNEETYMPKHVRQAKSENLPLRSPLGVTLQYHKSMTKKAKDERFATDGLRLERASHRFDKDEDAAPVKVTKKQELLTLIRELPQLAAFNDLSIADIQLHEPYSDKEGMTRVRVSHYECQWQIGGTSRKFVVKHEGKIISDRKLDYVINAMRAWRKHQGSRDYRPTTSLSSPYVRVTYGIRKKSKDEIKVIRGY